MDRVIVEEEPIDPKIHDDLEGGRLKPGVFAHAKQVLDAADEANRRREAGQPQELPEKRPASSSIKPAPKQKKPQHQYSRMNTRSTKGKTSQSGEPSSTEQVQEGAVLPSKEAEPTPQELPSIRETEDVGEPENPWEKLPSADAVSSLDQIRKDSFKKYQKVKRIPFTDPSLVCEINSSTVFELEGVSYTVSAYEEMVMRFVELHYPQLPEPKDFDSVICLCHKAIYFVTVGKHPRPSSKCKMTLNSFSDKGLSSLVSTLSFAIIPAAYSKSEDILSDYPTVERRMRVDELRKEHYRLWYLGCFFSKIIREGFASVEPIHPFMVYDEDLRRYLNEVAVGSYTVDCLHISFTHKPVSGTSAVPEESSGTDDESDNNMDVDLEPVHASVVEEVENRIALSIPKDHSKKLKTLETTVGQIDSNLRGALTQINQLGDAIKNIDVKFAQFMAKTATSSLTATADVNKTLLAPTAGATSTAKLPLTSAVTADTLTAKLAELSSKPADQAMTMVAQPTNPPPQSSLEKKVNAVVSLLMTPKLNSEKMGQLKNDLISVYKDLEIPDAQRLVENEKFKHLGTRVAVAESLKKKLAGRKG